MSLPGFQLLDQPWIPVEMLDGRFQELSLTQTFDGAAEIRRIADPSPLVTMAMYRLLFAIMHRAVPVRTTEERSDLWDEGTAHLRVIAYLQTWRHRFDLFDTEAPFWQIPDMTSEFGVMSWAKLAAELNDNNNKVLFDHTRTTHNPPTASPAQVARALVACQMLSVGAGRSKVGYNVNAVLATTLLVVPEADTLADTLLANTQLVEAADDLPIWEQPVVRVAQVEAANTATPVRTFAWKGPASRLTWLTRAIRIEPPGEDGEVVSIAFGAGYRPEVPEGDRDPWAAYRAKDGVWIPQRLSLEKAVWRDLHAIAVQSEKDKHDVARVFQDLDKLVDAERPLPRTWTLLIAGQAADKAKILGWGQQRWRIPDVLLHDASLGAQVAQATEEATATAVVLRRLAFRLAGDLVTLNSERKVDAGEQGKLSRALPTLVMYWSSLERAFAQFLLDLGDRSGGERDDIIDQARSRWARAIADAIGASEQATHATLGRDARSLRAWARTGPRFGRERARRLRQAGAYGGVKS